MVRFGSLLLATCITAQAQTVQGVIVFSDQRRSIAVVNHSTVRVGDQLGHYAIQAIMYDGVIINGKLVNVSIGKKTQILPQTETSIPIDHSTITGITRLETLKQKQQ